MNKEPSGVRLLRLINTRILQIARRESANDDRLCLYGTGGYWTAFERSAYQLSRLFPDLESFVVNPPGCPFTIVGLTIPEKELKKYMKKHSATRQDLDYLEFAEARFDTESYDDWHKKIVKDYETILLHKEISGQQLPEQQNNITA